MLRKQKYAKGQVIDIPQGRALGGSSAINAQAYVPPSKLTVDAWGSLGNEGWSWDTLAPYFRKSHTLTLPDQSTCEHLRLDWVTDEIRGASGPVQVSFTGTVEDPLTKTVR